MARPDNDDDQLLRRALAEACDTKALELGAGTLTRVPDVLRSCFGRKPAALVADTNTWEAAGRQTKDILDAAGVPVVDSVVFDGRGLHAEQAHVDRLRAAWGRHKAVPVAVGSGTINDLTKLASHRCGRAYLSVATAASMDGYTAFGASIEQEGLKQTFSCPAPRAVVADLNVLTRAPVEMNVAGYGDLIAKVTAGADWLIADALGVEPIHETAWSLVQERLRDWIVEPAAVRRGDPEAIRKLILGLLMTGFALQSARSSRPGSGAEHQFSHLWDMQGHRHKGQVPYHGCKVGLGTLVITGLYEQLLAQQLDRLPIKRICDAWPRLDERLRRVERSFASDTLRAVAATEVEAKYVDRQALAVRLRRLTDCWSELRERLREQLIPFSQLIHLSHEAGLPSAEGIGITLPRLRRSVSQAQQIRRRYTVLDLALETGLLESSVDAMFQASDVRELARPS